MRILLYALMLFLTLGITISRNFLERLGVETDYLVMTLLAVVVTGFLMNRGLALIVLIISLSVAINLPQGFLEQYAIDRDVLMVLQVIMIVFPLGYKKAVKYT